MPNRLAEIRARLEAAKEMNWRASTPVYIFQTNAPADLQWLLDENERLRKALEEKCKTCDGTGAEFPGTQHTEKCEECNGSGKEGN